MATFKENLKQTFANFKTKYIGNVPEGVTVAQINQHLTELERSGAMPTFDFAHPLHTFSGTNLSYTAVADCYVVGTLTTPAGTNNTVSLSVNTAIIYQANGQTNYNTPEICKVPMPILRLQAGDIVTVSSECASLHVYAPM